MEYIKLTFVGDVMCQKELLDAFKIKEGFSFDSAFNRILPMLKESDLSPPVPTISSTSPS